MIYLILVLILSLGINWASIWYCYNLLKDRVSLVDLFSNFSPVIKEYENHLNSLSKMDMYFGDPTIMRLVEHTREVSQRLDDLLQSVDIEETNETKEQQ